jgi:hypothetical protein
MCVSAVGLAICWAGFRCAWCRCGWRTALVMHPGVTPVTAGEGIPPGVCPHMGAPTSASAAGPAPTRAPAVLPCPCACCLSPARLLSAVPEGLYPEARQAARLPSALPIPLLPHRPPGLCPPGSRCPCPALPRPGPASTSTVYQWDQAPSIRDNAAPASVQKGARIWGCPSPTSFTMRSWAHDAEGGPGDGIACIGSRARRRVRR